MKYFELASRRHSEIIKTALLPAIAAGLGRAALAAGRAVIRRPITSGMAALTTADVAGSAKRMANMAKQRVGVSPQTWGTI